MKNILSYFLGFSLLFLFSCVKEDVNELSGNIIMKQSFALPLGTKTTSIDAPSVKDTSSTLSVYGTGRYYYNELPYTGVLTFPPIYDTVQLNLTAKTKADWIKRLTFNIKTINSYPAQASLQIYLVDEDGNLLDQVFGTTTSTFPEAKIDSKTGAIEPSEKVIEVVYEGAKLELLKKTRYMKYQIVVFSNLFKTIHLSDNNKVLVTIGAKADLEYNTKDINN